MILVSPTPDEARFRASMACYHLLQRCPLVSIVDIIMAHGGGTEPMGTLAWGAEVEVRGAQCGRRVHGGEGERWMRGTCNVGGRGGDDTDEHAVQWRQGVGETTSEGWC